MHVLAVHTNTQNLCSILLELFPHRVTDNWPQIGRDGNGWLLQQFSTAFELGCVLALGWSVFVIAFDMFTMVTGAKAAVIAVEPSTVGVSGDVKPTGVGWSHG